MDYNVEYLTEYLEDTESPTSYKRIQVWSDGDTRKLLDLYSTYLPEIGPLKKFPTKKDMWAEIAMEINEKPAKQCEERYKTVLKRKKVAVGNNRASGSKRKSIDFEQEQNKISLIDDSIELEILISSSNYIKVEKTGSIKKQKVKNKTVQETLIELAEKKEEARERRHKEKMEMLKLIMESKTIE